MDAEGPAKIRTLLTFFSNAVERFPNNLALSCDDVNLTYRDLDRKSDQLASQLLNLGVSPKHVVAVLLERCLNSYITFLAILKTGATYLPLDKEYPKERIEYILADTKPHVVITTSAIEAEFQLNNAYNYLFLDKKQILIDKIPAKKILPDISNTDRCYIIFTSGSTGQPKGVEISHDSICHYVETASQIYQINSADRIYQGFSLAFDASLEEICLAFANGASLIVCTQKEVRFGLGLTEFLNYHQVTILSTVPSLLANLTEEPEYLRILILGGEVCPTNLIKQWIKPNLKIFNTYGPTETTIIATIAECNAKQPVNIGKPLPGYEILLLNEKRQPVAQGEKGEICIGGKGVAIGYYNCPEKTQAKFINYQYGKYKSRLYCSGDLARINKDGNLEFLGRIDEQIKLRGFRIELEEIETVILEYKNILQAVAALKEINSPALAAYIKLEENTSIDLSDFQDWLKKRLPSYMVPTFIEIVTNYPTLPNGKINKKALPDPKIKTQKIVMPSTESEEKIAAVWQEQFNMPLISVEADFFYDLGGHSLAAAQVISKLRLLPSLEHISIIDLYQNPTIKTLAKKFHAKNFQFTNEKQRDDLINKTSNFDYYLCAIGQFFGILFQYAVKSWQLLTIILFYFWLNTNQSISSAQAFILSLSFLFVFPLVSLMLVVTLKWILLGKIKPGNYKLWGWFYLRWWLIECLQKNVFALNNYVGTPLIILYYRMLGAKIGKNCYIATTDFSIHDQITIGNDVSIGYDAQLMGYIIEDGLLKIGSIQIGDECFIGARSNLGINTIVENGGILDSMSMLPAHSKVTKGRFFTGSPAKQSIANKDHITQQKLTKPVLSFGARSCYVFLQYLAVVVAMSLYYVSYLPAIYVVNQFGMKASWLGLLLSLALGGMIFVYSYCLTAYLAKKLLLLKVYPGLYALKSLVYIKHWLLIKINDAEEIHAMADSLYLPYLMRLLGAKIGKNVEMGNTMHILPDLINLEKDAFIASSTAMAWPEVYLGHIKLAKIQIDKKGFLGNLAYLTNDYKLGENSLLGCLSVPPSKQEAQRPNSAWLGSPAFFLPRREINNSFSEKQTFYPPKKLYFLRLVIEFFRITLPSVFNFTALMLSFLMLETLIHNYPLGQVIFMAPLYELGIYCSLVSAAVGLKWLILGRVKPIVRPVWDIYIWKIDIVEYLFTYFVCPNFAEYILGSPFMSMLLRCFGTKVGKKAFINSIEFTEFDLITLGDEVTINSHALIQTHLFEDRIFKADNIIIKNNCHLGILSVVQYNTVMHNYSSLHNFSLLMKGERLPAYSNWQGIPAQPLFNMHPLRQKNKILVV